VKKASLILLLVIYATASFGVGVKTFYCCGKLKSFQISFAGGKNDKSARGAGCCKTIHKFFKVRDNHMAAVDMAKMVSPFTGLTAPVSIFETPFNTPLQVVAANRSNAPPLFAGSPLYLRNCVFLI
jgi:hypothetical protein